MPLFFKPLYVDEEAEEDEEDLAKPVQELVFQRSFCLCVVHRKGEKESARKRERDGEYVCVIVCVYVFVCVCAYVCVYTCACVLV